MSYQWSELSLRTLPRLTEGAANAKEWEAKRAAILDGWIRILGKPSVDLALKDAEYMVVDEARESDHIRLHIHYQAYDGDTISAYLLLPDSYEQACPCPAILALHPTSDAGKADVAVSWGRPNRQYGLELVSRGYIVIAPDTITAGERVESGQHPFLTSTFYERHPEWTAVGKMVSDHRRTLDILSAVEGVDAARIGVIGHSLGGYNGWFLAGLDSRIRAVVSSCGFSMFTDDPDPNRWGRREWFSHIPEITDYLAADRLPFEWHEIAALAAPTPFFLWGGMNDPIFPNWMAIAAGAKEIGSVYELLKQPSSFECLFGNVGHDFPVSIRKYAYEFLDQALRVNEHR